MQSYITIKKESCAEKEVKRSKFIACGFIINNEDEAALKLSAVRKKYAGADHICYAYYICGGTSKHCDDREPAKTAGYPILEAIKGRNLCNTLVTVARYFGGVKLGTGGLSRAYGGAAADVLDISGRVNYVYSAEYTVKTDYTFSAAAESAVCAYGEITAKNYDSGADISAVCPYEKADEVRERLLEITGGKAEIAVTGSRYYPYKNS